MLKPMVSSSIRVITFKNNLFLRMFSSSHRLDTEGSDTSKLIVRKYNAIMMIGFNRPEKKNAFDSEMFSLFQNALDDFENDDSIQAGVLFGDCGNFCAGYESQASPDNDTIICSQYSPNNLTSRILKKPLVAAVAGYAVGFGMDLALWCDIRIMEETAVMACTSQQLGCTLSESGIIRLNSMVGLSHAMDLLLTGRLIEIEELVSCGLATRTTHVGTATGCAYSVANVTSKTPLASFDVDRTNILQAAFSRCSEISKTIPPLPENHEDKVFREVSVGSKFFTRGHGKHGETISGKCWYRESKKEEAAKLRTIGLHD